MEGLCRTCLAAVGIECSSVSVFNETEMGDTIAVLLTKYCCLEITEDDQLPKEICLPCLNELIITINFRRKCVNSEQGLLQMLEEKQTETVPTDENVEPEPKPIFVEVLENQDETNSQLPVESQEDDEPAVDCYSTVEMVSFRCCLCSAILYNEEDHRDHVELIHEIKFPDDTSSCDTNQTCFICSRSFASLDELETHQGKSFLELFQCNTCEDIYETVDHVLQHCHQAHSVKIEEHHETFESATHLVTKEPKRKTTSEAQSKERYCCVTHCHDVFKNEQQLLSHAQEKHILKLKYNQEKNDTTNKPFVCNVCFRSFGSMKNLKVHQFVRANNVDGKHFSCIHCPFRTVSRNLLTIHDRSKHSGERPFKCSHCDKRFYSEMHLKNHLVCHSVDRPFQCSFCEKNFSRKRNMEEHVRSCHSEEKPFSCEVCPARFKVSQHLRIHARIHSGEKPYKCSFCDNSYYHISDRKRHEMSHTGEKPHKCGNCGAAFTRKRTLTIHERTHSGERPYSCTICGKGFCQNATLKKHMERHVRDEISFTTEVVDDPSEFYTEEV